jgi:EGF domain-containing protein
MIAGMFSFTTPRWITQSVIGVSLVLTLAALFSSGAANALGQSPAPAATKEGMCPAGFSGSPDTKCVDVNECAVRNGGCNKLAACINTPGSRTCGVCPEDFAGDGYVGCFDANECPNGDCTSRLPLGFETAEAPVITTSGDVTVTASSAEGAVATFTATAQDKLYGKLPVTCSPASGSTFPVGKTTVSCWATNGLGKLRTAALAVTVGK